MGLYALRVFANMRHFGVEAGLSPPSEAWCTNHNAGAVPQSFKLT